LYFYNARSHDTANVIGRVDSHVLNDNVFVVLLNTTQFSGKTVSHPRSLDSEAAVAVVRSCTSNSQSTSVWRSKLPAAECWHWLAIRHEGTAEPCHVDTWIPELMY